MSFGHVFIIRFNLALVLLFASLSANANFETMTTKALQFEYTKAYESLNEKLEQCSILGDLRTIEITDEWLKSLSNQTQRIVLFVLAGKADKRCAQVEESRYVQAMFELAVIGEDNALNDYIKLQQYGKLDDDALKILNKLNPSELLRLSRLEKYQQPFNAMTSLSPDKK
ncbi:hypothetical protein [Vibrio sp. M260112]|uniref:hypothetical protein n=1 Tax=Vibrio sp. M260112 TaxID=3020895 RepID=UPI002F415145